MGLAPKMTFQSFTPAEQLTAFLRTWCSLQHRKLNYMIHDAQYHASHDIVMHKKKLVRADLYDLLMDPL